MVLLLLRLLKILFVAPVTLPKFIFERRYLQSLFLELPFYLFGHVGLRGQWSGVIESKECLGVRNVAIFIGMQG